MVIMKVELCLCQHLAYNKDPSYVQCVFDVSKSGCCSDD